MSYNTILFDLDGTLMNTSPGIFDTANYTMEQLGLPRVPEVQLRKFVGPPLAECFRVACNLDESLIGQACDIYRVRYDSTGRFMASVYDGIFDVLDTLKGRGNKLGVSTLKLERLAKEVLEYFKLASYFDIIVGADAQGKRTKADIVDLSVAQLGNVPYESAVLVGDTPHDMIGAQTAGVDFLAVDYGFGFAPGTDLSGQPRFIGMAANPSQILTYLG